MCTPLKLKESSGEINHPKFILIKVAHCVIHFRFKSLQDDVFSNAVRLTELDLSGNELRTVPSVALESLKHLSILRLRNNGIKAIHPLSFSDLPLDILDLGDNHVPIQIYPKAFCGLKPRVTHVQTGVR